MTSCIRHSDDVIKAFDVIDYNTNCMASMDSAFGISDSDKTGAFKGLKKPRGT